MMKATQKPYHPDPDFLRVRDFLSETWGLPGKPLNWRIERWNYARYFVIPMIGAYGKKETTVEDSLAGIRWWEEQAAIWENERGEIVGVIGLEYPWRGDAFLLRHPDYDAILPEMLDYVERVLVDPEKRRLTIHIYDYDAAQQALAQQRGYCRIADPEVDSVYTIGEIPEPNLPPGFCLRSMADEQDIEKRREMFGRSFNHTDPAEWPSAFSYQELQRAPDYRKEQDLYVVAPSGQYVSGCIIWYDARSRIGILEPVGTHPDYRRRGFGREVVLEAIRRAKSLGAQKVWVGSGQLFYQALGFQKTLTSYAWEKNF
jgi:predicted N-acetyltransferase YhbS